MDRRGGERKRVGVVNSAVDSNYMLVMCGAWMSTISCLWWGLSSVRVRVVIQMEEIGSCMWGRENVSCIIGFLFVFRIRFGHINIGMFISSPVWHYTFA